MNSLLLTRPYYDPATYYLYNWAKLVIQLAKHKRYRVIDLDNKRANIKELTDILKKRNIDLIMFNGHGSEDSIFGQDHRVIMKAGDNDHLLNKTTVYAIACSAGKTLGPSCVLKGAFAFIGYKNVFVFWRKQDKENHPLQDEWAKLFFEPSNQVMISLLKGHKPSEAHRRSQELLAKNIQSVLTGSSTDSFLAPSLIWNYQNQVCIEQ